MITWKARTTSGLILQGHGPSKDILHGQTVEQMSLLLDDVELMNLDNKGKGWLYFHNFGHPALRIPFHIKPAGRVCRWITERMALVPGGPKIQTADGIVADCGAHGRVGFQYLIDKKAFIPIRDGGGQIEIG